MIAPRVELRPRRVVLAAVVVAGLEIVPAIEVELPHVLAHRVPPHAAAGAIADVVVDLAVVDERAVPEVAVAAVAAARGVGDVLRLDVVACGS